MFYLLRVCTARSKEERIIKMKKKTTRDGAMRIVRLTLIAICIVTLVKHIISCHCVQWYKRSRMSSVWR